MLRHPTYLINFIDIAGKEWKRKSTYTQLGNIAVYFCGNRREGETAIHCG